MSQGGGLTIPPTWLLLDNQSTVDEFANGHNPSTKDFLRIVARNQLPNCPITRDDILAAEDIFGPDIGSLKGKTTRRKPHRV
jgi:hypothetical protein